MRVVVPVLGLLAIALIGVEIGLSAAGASEMALSAVAMVVVGIVSLLIGISMGHQWAEGKGREEEQLYECDLCGVPTAGSRVRLVRLHKREVLACDVCRAKGEGESGG